MLVKISPRRSLVNPRGKGRGEGEERRGEEVGREEGKGRRGVIRIVLALSYLTPITTL